MIQEFCCLFSLSILDIPNTMVLPGDLASPVACYVLQGLSCKHLGFPHQHCQGPGSTCTKGGWAWGKEQIALKKPKVPIQIVVEPPEVRATGYLT